MTAGRDTALLASFRLRVEAHPLLAGLREDYLEAVVAASPSSDADELRTIARDYAPLHPGQVLPLWSAWRQSQREVQAATPEPESQPDAAPVFSSTPTTVFDVEPDLAATAESDDTSGPESAPEATAEPDPAPVSSPEPTVEAAPESAPPLVDEPTPPAEPAPVYQPEPVDETPSWAPPAPAASEPVGQDAPPAGPFEWQFQPDAGVPTAETVTPAPDVEPEPAAVTPDALDLVPDQPVTGFAAPEPTAEPAADPDPAPFAMSAPQPDPEPAPQQALPPVVHTTPTAAPAVEDDETAPPPDVERLRGRPGGRDIRLAWTRPDGASGVRVYRNRGVAVPTDYFVHLRQPVDTDASEWADADVDPGVVYHYRVTTTDDAGHESAGVDVEVSAPRLPIPLTDLDLQTVPSARTLAVDLSWPVPADGAEIWVLAADTEPQRPVPHEQVTTDRIAELGLGERAHGEASVVAGRAVLADVAVPTDGARVWFTAVSVIGEIAVVGLTVAAIAVAAPTDVEVVDRVSWQLVRFEWPAGATYVDVAPAYGSDMAPGEPPVWASRLRINRDRYDRDGGALFDVRHPLDVVPHDLALRGVDRYAGREQHGPAVTVAYPGRWMVDYHLAHPSRHSSARLYTVEVRSLHPQSHWQSPGVAVRVLHHPYRMPLSPTGTDVNSLPIHRDADHGMSAVELPPGALLAGVPTAIGQVELPDGFVRVVVDSLDPRVPATVLDPPPPVLLPPSRRVNARLAPHQFRCRRCLAVSDRMPQVFECEFRDCAGRGPNGPQRFTPPTPPPPPGAPFGPPLVAGADCPACRRRSTREICKQCMTAVPAAWFATEPFPVVMAGAKATGKSVFAHVAMTQLQDRVARDLPGHITEFDAETARRLHDLRELFRGRMLPVSTQGEDGFRPLTFTVSSNQEEPRQRTLAVHDLSGDWIQDRGAVDRYRDQLSRAAGIVFLVDVLQVPDVVDYLQGDVATFSADSLQDPTKALTNVISAIRARVGLPPDIPIQVPIAVVISKLDALHLLTRSTRGGGDAPEAATSVRRGMALTRDPYGGGANAPLYDPADAWWAHQETRSLLTSLRAGALVEIVERNFAAFRYFGVSALGHSPAPGQRGVSSFAPFRVDEPFRWLLAEQW